MLGYTDTLETCRCYSEEVQEQQHQVLSWSAFSRSCSECLCKVLSNASVHNGVRVNYFEQRVALKFLVNWGKSWQETSVALQIVYGDHIKSKSSFYKWYKLFTEGREDCNNALLFSRPFEVLKTISRWKVKQALKDDRWLSVWQIASLTRINREPVRKILTGELDMRKMCVKLAPKNLTNEQKETRIRICIEWLEYFV